METRKDIKKRPDWYYLAATIGMLALYFTVSPEAGIVLGLSWILVRKAFPWERDV